MSFSYPSEITESAEATVTAAVNIDSPSGSGMVGAFINFNDGRKQLHFFLDQADWSVASTILGHFWLQWVSNGLYAGMRRILFNPQVDDMFMPTGMYESALKAEGRTEVYRINTDDLQVCLFDL